MTEIKDNRYVRGAQRLGTRISRIKQVLSVAVVVELAGPYMKRRTLERFDREVDPDENPWKKHAPSTLRRRRSKPGTRMKNGRPKILEDSGQMRNAIRAIRGRADGAVYTNTGAGVRIGITDPKQVPKAFVHQRGWEHVPQRRFLGVGRKDTDAISAMLRRAAERAGLDF